MGATAGEIERELADYLTQGQACRMAGVSEAWMRSLVISGRLPCIRTPAARLIPRAAIESYVRDREAQRSVRLDAA